MPNDTKTEFKSQARELHDYRNGKERPWREKKEQNTVYADILAVLEVQDSTLLTSKTSKESVLLHPEAPRYSKESLMLKEEVLADLATLAVFSSKKVARVSQCADVLRFAVTDTGHLKLKQTWFCKSRLCPMCAWRRSIKYAVDVSKIVEEAVKREPNGGWLFLTLTTKNTTNADDLSKEIKSYSVALRKMLRSKSLKDMVLGFSRGIEVTVNKKDGTYNQHMHVLLFVKSTYFVRGYLKKAKWIDLWREAMDLDYDPSVDVRAVKGETPDERFKAVLEVAKYPVKSTDYLSGDDEENFDNNLEIVRDLEEALYRKRLTAFGGLLKTIQKELNIKDIDSDKADLIATGEEVEQEAETGQEISARWDSWNKKYYID